MDTTWLQLECVFLPLPAGITSVILSRKDGSVFLEGTSKKLTARCVSKN